MPEITPKPGICTADVLRIRKGPAVIKGLNSGLVHEPILSSAQLEAIQVVATQTFDGDATRFRLAIEAQRLGLAYEYDPYFALSIARVDPLPHQLEAVYDNFLTLPRIRFLLADDPGAGKTIMIPRPFAAPRSRNGFPTISTS